MDILENFETNGFILCKVCGESFNQISKHRGYKCLQCYKDYENAYKKKYRQNTRSIEQKQKEQLYQREYQKKYKDIIRRYKKMFILNNFPYRDYCKNKYLSIRNKIQDRKYRQKVRLKVFNHYTNNNIQCKNCGELDIDVLTIDHINGGGNKHYKEIGRGATMYRWVIKNNYPNNLQILCMNCQRIKVIENKECWYIENRNNKQRNYQCKTNKKIKQEIFNYYGNRCNYCNKNDIRYLQFDHINNDGANNRKLFGPNLYYQLRRQNFPSLESLGLQILCANCNHKKEKEKRRNG